MVSCFALDRCRYTSLCRSLRHVGRGPTEFPSNLLQHLKAALFSVFTRQQGTNEASWYHRIFLRIASKPPRPWHFSEKMKLQSNCGPSSMTHRIVHFLCSASKAKSARCWPCHGGQDLLIVPTEFISHITSSTVICLHSWWFMVLQCPSCRFTPNLHDFLETFAKLLEPKPWSLAAPTPQRSVPCPAGSITSHGPRPQHLSSLVNSVETDYYMIFDIYIYFHYISHQTFESCIGLYHAFIYYV